jgi:hypothetical protein
MGYDLLGVLLFAVLVPLVILGFVAFWVMTNHERAFIEETWETYAAARDREYVPARGDWPNRTSPSVRWRREDIDFALTVVGAEAQARTRMVAWPRNRLLGTFVVRAGTKGGEENAGIGDAVFSQTFALSERPAGLAKRVLDDAARRALLGFRQRDNVALSYRRGRLILEWPGRESNDARLDEAERVVGELVRGVEAAFLGGTPRAAT